MMIIANVPVAEIEAARIQKAAHGPGIGHGFAATATMRSPPVIPFHMLTSDCTELRSSRIA
jgi:hypothetical protein